MQALPVATTLALRARCRRALRCNRLKSALLFLLRHVCSPARARQRRCRPRQRPAWLPPRSRTRAAARQQRRPQPLQAYAARRSAAALSAASSRWHCSSFAD